MSSIAEPLSTQPRHFGLLGLEVNSETVFETSQRLADFCKDEKEGSNVD